MEPILNQLSKAWGVVFLPHPESRTITVTKGDKVVSWARLITLGERRGESISIPLEDWVQMRVLAEKTLLKWMLVAQFPDGAAYWLVKEPHTGIHYPYEHAQDGPCVRIPIKEFKLVMREEPA